MSVLEKLLSQHWDSSYSQSPRVFRDVGSRTWPIEADDLVDGVQRMALRQPYIRVASPGGPPVPAERFCKTEKVEGRLVQGIASPTELARLTRSGCTVMLDNMEHWHPKLGDTLSSLSAELLCAVESVGFLTPSGHNGLGTHVDTPDVFILQLAGSKKWRIHERVPEWRGRGRPLPDGKVPDVVLETDLRGGDVLFVPSGCAHSTTAGITGSAHLSIMVFTRTFGEVADGAVRADLRMVSDVYGDVPALREALSWPVLDAMPSGVRASIPSKLLDLEQVRVSNRPVNIVSREYQAAAMGISSRVSISASLAGVGERSPGGVPVRYVTVDGRRFDIGTRMQEVLGYIDHHDGVEVAALVERFGESAMLWSGLRMMVRFGVLGIA